MATEHFELEFRGAPLLVRGFLHGIAAARGLSGEIHFGAEVGFRDTGWLERLIGDLGGGARVTTRVVVTDAARRIIEQALATQTADLPIELARARRVVGAHFRARVITFSKEAAARIRARLDNPPPGVELVGYRPVEERHAESKGIELYAPEHDYRFEAEFEARGAFEPVSELHRFCREEELIEEDEVRLELTEG